MELKHIDIARLSVSSLNSKRSKSPTFSGSR